MIVINLNYTPFTSKPEKRGILSFLLSFVFFTFNLVGSHVRSLYTRCLSIYKNLIESDKPLWREIGNMKTPHNSCKYSTNALRFLIYASCSMISCPNHML